MTTGIVTGFEIAKNRNGTTPVVLLQVRISTPEDIQTVELMTPPGDESIPVDGTTVIILNVGNGYKIAVAQQDQITPTIAAGEKKIYSQDGTGIKASLYLDSSGNVILNSGIKTAVSYAALDAALQGLVIAINAAFATKLDSPGAPGTITLNTSSAEVPGVKLP